jgi:hypothetical protein
LVDVAADARPDFHAFDSLGASDSRVRQSSGRIRN